MKTIRYARLLMCFVALFLFFCAKQKELTKPAEQPTVIPATPVRPVIPPPVVQPIQPVPVKKSAEQIHQEAITLDTHVDIGSNMDSPRSDPGSDSCRNKCTLPKMEKGGLDGVFMAVYTAQGRLDSAGFENAYNQAMAKFTAVHKLTEQMHPDRCTLALTPDDVRRIEKTGKRAIIIGVENGYPLKTDITNVKKFYDLGGRYITLCHSGDNQICTSAGSRVPDSLRTGITDFGKQVVDEMNRLGIMVDVSHISKQSFWDAIKYSKAPIIASHSGCMGIQVSNRNLDDDQLKALAQNGGVIQIVALAGYLHSNETPEHQKAIQDLQNNLNFRPLTRTEVTALSQEDQTKYNAQFAEYRTKQTTIDSLYPRYVVSVKDFVDHIDYAVKIAGIDHVGVGTDFDGGGGIPGFNDHSDCLNVTKELVNRGYSEQDIKKIWGENLLRVWSEVENVAKQLQK